MISLHATTTVLDQKMTLIRRTVYEQCNFTFPLSEYAEFEANPDIVGSPIQMVVGVD